MKAHRRDRQSQSKGLHGGPLRLHINLSCKSNLLSGLFDDGPTQHGVLGNVGQALSQLVKTMWRVGLSDHELKLLLSRKAPRNTLNETVTQQLCLEKKCMEGC